MTNEQMSRGRSADWEETMMACAWEAAVTNDVRSLSKHFMIQQLTRVATGQNILFPLFEVAELCRSFSLKSLDFDLFDVTVKIIIICTDRVLEERVVQ